MSRQTSIIIFRIVLFSFIGGSACLAQIEQPILKKIDSLQRIGKWAEVKPLIESNIDKADNDRLRYTLNFILALAQSQTDDHLKAEMSLKRALAINPKSGTAWGNYGWELYLNGKIDSCLIASEKALALDSTLTYVIGNIGLVQLRKGKDMALKTYKRAGDMLFDKGDINTFNGIYGDLVTEKEKLLKNRKLYDQVIAYMDSMRDLVQQKADLEK